MKTLLLRLSVLLTFLIPAGTLFAQETTDNATYYYNNFETSTAGNLASLGAASKGNANRVGTSTSIDATTSGPLNGSTSLGSVFSFTNVGTLRYNFVGNGTSGINLNSNDWEWDFIYQNTLALPNDDPDQNSLGKNAWRFWLTASSYNGNNMQGFYISHVGTNLVLRYRYTTGSGANQYNTILTTPLPNNQATYIIKVQRLQSGSWAIYLDNFTAGMTTAKTLAVTTTGTTGSGFATYYYSYLESTCTSTNRFKWDDINMYTRVLQFTAVGANSVATNNITPSPLAPNQSNIIMYGMQIIARGNFNLNQIVFATTGAGFDGYFNGTGTLYKTTSPSYNIATATSVASLSLTGNSASNYTFQDYITTSGNTDGTFSTPGYYFLVGSTKSTLNYGSPPTGNITFNSLTTVTGNANGNGTNGTSALNYSVTGAPAGTTMTFANPSPPNISYATPQTYYVGTPITGLGPTNTGSAVGSYGAVSTFTTVANSNGTAVDASGNVYVTSTSGNVVYTYNSSGALINTRSGYSQPNGIIIDPSGNSYVANGTGSNVIKTTPGGVQSTITGSFSRPVGIVMDAAGNMYVTDYSNSTIYKINAGSTTATPYITGITNPWGIAINAAGDLYISSLSNNYIYKVPAGSTTPSPFVTSGLNSPRNMVVDALGNIYESDANSGKVNFITPSGTITTLLSGLDSPVGLSLDASGNIYTAGYNFGTVYKSVASGYSVSPTLPAGLTFNKYTGGIGGTPTTPSAATNYTVTATNAYGSSNAVVNITVIYPTAPTAGNVSRCGAGSVSPTASGSLPAGGTYNWYSAATGGTLLQSGTATTYTASIVTTTTYYVSYTSGTYTTARTPVTATINPIVSSPYSGANFSYAFTGNTKDVSGNGNDGLATGGPTLTTDRYGVANSAYNFNGSSQYISSTISTTSPTTFSISLWFNTTVAGGKLIGFGGSQTGASTTYDRHLYMSSTGQLYFGEYNGSFSNINTTASYNDGNWHHVIVTSSPSGSALYVDGVSQASSTLTATVNYTGYWRIGYDAISTGFYPAATANAFYSGKLDDIAVYNRVLSAAEIASSNDINQIGNYTAVCSGNPITLYAPTITGATYTWTSPSGATQTGQNPTFASAQVGNYSLTVTGGPGGCSSTATVVPVVNSASANFSVTTYVLVGNNATVTYTGTDPASSTYVWNFNGGTVVSGSGQGPYQVQWASAGAKTVTLTVTNANGCSATYSQPVTVSTSGWYDKYVYRKKITVNKSQVAGNTDLTNFPLLVKIIDPDLIYTPGICTNKIQSSTFNDLAFTDGTTNQSTELPYQIDTYDPVTGTLLVWVRVPLLAASGSTTPSTSINMYFGNTTPPVQHTTAFQQTTWNNATSSNVNYNSVWHFNEAPLAGNFTILDGTSSGVNLAANNGLVTSLASAQIGKGMAFGSTPGSGGYLSSSSLLTSYPTNGTPITMSYWCNYPNTPGSGGTNSTQNGMVLCIASGGLVQLGFTNGVTELWPYGGRSTPYANSSSMPSNNTWHHYVYSFDGTNNAMYIDGVAQTASTTYNPTGQAATIYNRIMFGDFPNDVYSEEFNGNIDEAHFIATALTPSWVKTEYNNQLNPTNIGTGPTISAIANIEYNASNYNAGYSPGSLIYTWNGSAGSNIYNAANWTITSITPNVAGTGPVNLYASINIPGSLSAYPQLSGTYYIYSVTLGSGAQLDLNGNILGVGCDINNTTGGKIIYSNNTASKITWNGSLPTQNYYGSTTAGTGQTGDMEVNNSSAGTVNISSGVLDVYDVLTMTKGNLVVGASPAVLTLKSQASQTASVAAITSGSTITGIVNVERYLSGGVGHRGYRLMSSPVFGSTANSNNIYTVNYLINNVYLSGTGGTSNGFDKSGNPSLYLYRENLAYSNATFVSGNFRGISTLGTAPNYSYYIDIDNGPYNIPVGNGYLFFFRGDRTAASLAAETVTSYVPTNTVVTTSGSLNQGQVIVHNWYTPTSAYLGYTTTSGNAAIKGFNLVGNPYASSIDWEQYNTSSTTSGIYANNVGITVFEYNPTTSNYNIYQKGGTYTNAGSNIISSGQGFFVQAANSTNPQLIFNETAKTSAQSTGVNLFMTTQANIARLNGAEIHQHLRLQLAKDTINTDDIYLGFAPDASAKYVFNEDVPYKKGYGQVSLSSISSDNIDLGINRQPLPKQSSVIPLDVSATASGSYKLNMTEIVAIPAIYDIWLKDAYKKDSLDIRNNRTYSFDLVKSDTNTYGSKRFSLVLRQNQALAMHLLNFNATRAVTGIQTVWKTENEQNYTYFTVQRSTNNGVSYDVLGGFISANRGLYSFLDTKPVKGTAKYRLKLEDLNGQVTYSNVVTIGSGSVSTTADSTLTAGISVYPNPTNGVLNLSIKAPQVFHSIPMLQSTDASTTTAQVAQSYNIKIINVTGSVVKNVTSSQPDWQDNISTLLPGTYVIQVTNNSDKSLVGKCTFVKM